MSAFSHPYFKPSASSTDMPEPPECKCSTTYTVAQARGLQSTPNRAERRKRAAMKRRGKEPKS